MRRVYENSPLVEALCEFRFEPGQPWDWAVPGLFYREVQEEFPTRRQFNPFQVKLSSETQEASVQSVVSNVERMQFVRQDERALIQVGPDLMSVHHLKPYSNWETFKQMISRSLDVYKQVASPKNITHIGLRYINRLEIPEEQTVKIERFLLAVPSVPEEVPQTFSTWWQRVEIPYVQANGLLALHSGSVYEEGQTNVIFLLDLDFVTLQADLVTLDDAIEWVDRAHDEVEKTFEACITAETRQLIGEVRYGE